MFAIAKRVFLFLLLNAVVMLTISLLLNVLGFNGYLTESGINTQALLLFCLVWGMGGSMISLLLSKTIAKWTMKVQVIPQGTHDPELQSLLERVHALARSAGITKMPEVGIYDSPELNAFATGATRNSALVAVSTGLLRRMSPDEVDGVLGHEITHVANGDMVTMTLLQGVVNAFVMFLARILAFAVSQALRDRNDGSGGLGYFARYMLIMLFEMVLMFFGSMIVATFSRWREYRADAGGARLAGRDKMIAALQRLQANIGVQDPQMDSPSVQSFKISGGKSSRLALLFATHPPLESRIERLMRA